MKYDLNSLIAVINIEMYPAADGTKDTIVKTTMIGTHENIALIFVRLMEQHPETVALIEAALIVNKEFKNKNHG